MSEAQYNNIGGQYDAVKSLPVAILELAGVKKYIGDVNQLEVLDLACGTGYYSQKLIEWGAKRVVSIDISQAMVDYAKQKIGVDNRCEFCVADCKNPLDVGQYDLVLAVWFLNYATNEEELLGMWRNISRSLKPGGRVMGITTNFDLLQSVPEGDRFGLVMDPVKKIEAGEVFHLTVTSQPPFEFHAYVLEREVYERTAKEAGITSLEWKQPVDPERPDIDFQEFARAPHMQLFTASH